MDGDTVRWKTKRLHLDTYVPSEPTRIRLKDNGELEFKFDRFAPAFVYYVDKIRGGRDSRPFIFARDE